jgi:hypothetical protein
MLMNFDEVSTIGELLRSSAKCVIKLIILPIPVHNQHLSDAL